MDRIRKVPSLPPPGGYVEVEEEWRLLGGEAANTANALRSWEDEVLIAGNPLGESSESRMLRRMLTDRHLELVELASSTGAEVPLATPVCDIYVTSNGERTMFGRGFADMEAYASLEKVPWRENAWFTAEPNMANLSREAATAAHKSGMRLYLMDFIRKEDPIYPGSFWQSSTDWAGHRNNVQRNVSWVKEWVARHGCFAVLSDGPNGFVAGSPELPIRTYPPFPAQLVVDTTGAGDFFRAGMLHGLSRGWPIPDCLRFASAAGCLKVRTLGATVDVPSAAEIEAHIKENQDVARQYG